MTNVSSPCGCAPVSRREVAAKAEPEAPLAGGCPCGPACGCGPACECGSDGSCVTGAKGQG